MKLDKCSLGYGQVNPNYAGKDLKIAMEEQLLEKKELRQKYDQMRNMIAESDRWEIDSVIASRFNGLPAYQNAEIILCYLSMGSEVETRGIIQKAWEDGKDVAVPRCVPGTRTMEWYLISSFEGFVESSMGIAEPGRNDDLKIDPLHMRHAICIVPGLAFDEVGYRIGYGGGFYDIFLKDFFGVSVGLCRDASISEQSLRFDSHDLPVDLVLTETRLMGVAAFGR